jgi:hypothetical protein
MGRVATLYATYDMALSMTTFNLPQNIATQPVALGNLSFCPGTHDQ